MRHDKGSRRVALVVAPTRESRPLLAPAGGCPSARPQTRPRTPAFLLPFGHARGARAALGRLSSWGRHSVQLGPPAAHQLGQLRSGH